MLQPNLPLVVNVHGQSLYARLGPRALQVGCSGIRYLKGLVSRNDILLMILPMLEWRVSKAP